MKCAGATLEMDANDDLVLTYDGSTADPTSVRDWEVYY